MIARVSGGRSPADQGGDCLCTKSSDPKTDHSARVVIARVEGAIARAKPRACSRLRLLPELQRAPWTNVYRLNGQSPPFEGYSVRRKNGFGATGGGLCSSRKPTTLPPESMASSTRASPYTVSTFRSAPLNALRKSRMSL